MFDKIRESVFALALVLGLFATAMIFCPSVAVVVETEEEDYVVGVSAFKTVFGSDGTFKFSFWHFLMYVLPLIAIKTLNHSYKNYSKSAAIFTLVCFFLSAVLFFLATVTLHYETVLVKKLIKDSISIGAGAVIGGISCLLATFCTWGYIKDASFL